MKIFAIRGSNLASLAGDFDVASMTGTIPHPYGEQKAAEWLASARDGEEGVVFMIEREGSLIGCTGYRAWRCSSRSSSVPPWIDPSRFVCGSC